MKLNSWQKVQYRLLWWSCRAVGLLPERVLYFCLGGLIRLILYRLVRYRRQVVRTNLAHSFPEKSEAERREIERKLPSPFRSICRYDSVGIDQSQAHL